MPSLNALINAGLICQCLREKKMFYQPEDLGAPETIDILPPEERSAEQPQGPFWCAQTQSLLGPDGQIADFESCRPGRSCCETSD